MSKRRYDAHGFKEAFPSKKGRRIGMTNFVKCKQCGTFNDIRRTSLSSSGDGLVVYAKEVGPTTFDVYEYPIDHSARSGCRFCGSLNWASSKPAKFPDDNKIPATGWKRKRR